MNELRRGTQITGAFLKSLFLRMFNAINIIDPSYIKVTTGQIICTDDKDNPTKWADMLAVHSDQYYNTDIIPNPYASSNSYFQRYLDELDDIKKGV